MCESPRSSEKGKSRGPLPSLPPFSPLLPPPSIRPNARSPHAGWGGGGGGGRGGRQLVPRVPSSSSRSLLQGLDHARGLGAPTRRSARRPPSRPEGPRPRPRTHRSPPRCLSWRSPRSPCLGRGEEGVREGNGGWGRPAAPRAEATPTSARVRAASAPGADALSTGGKSGPVPSAGTQRTPLPGRRQRERRRRQAATSRHSPFPAPPSLRASGQPRAPAVPAPLLSADGRAPRM